MEWILVLAVFLPAASWLAGVWFSSEAERRAFSRMLSHFDDKTPDHRKTPKVRMTLYNRLIEKTRERTRRMFVAPPRPDTPPEVKALRDRRRVFLRFRSVAPDDEAKTLRMLIK